MLEQGPSHRGLRARDTVPLRSRSQYIHTDLWEGSEQKALYFSHTIVLCFKKLQPDKLGGNQGQHKTSLYRLSLKAHAPMLSNLPSLSFFPVHSSCVLEVDLYLQAWLQLSQSTRCSFPRIEYLCDLCSASQHLLVPCHSSTQRRRDPHGVGSHFVQLLNLSGLGHCLDLLWALVSSSKQQGCYENQVK